ncbi:MAG: putative endonuclease [Microgenomates group bacterium Gr01-1014_16]|nr:MAG: putative endonuclease [Microgenomates group bacterium Gr01-1014_16]
MFFVYALKSLKDNKLYIGYSNNPRERLEYHNKGKVEATKYRRPLEIIFLEGYLNQQDATSREKFFKTGWGRTHLKKVLSNYLKSNQINQVEDD